MDDEPSSSVLPRNEQALAPRVGFVVSSLTDLGQRHTINEDSHATLVDEEGSQVLALCDGMGGMGHGDKASQLAIATLSERLQADSEIAPFTAMTDAIRLTDVILRDRLCRGAKHPGSTATVALLRDGLAHVAWVGDSRAYLIRNGAIVSRTRDHRVVEGLIESGAMSREQAKKSPMARLLSRSVGGRGVDDAAVEVETAGPWSLRPDDILLLCTDGLHSMVEDEEICEHVTRLDPAAACRALVDLANSRNADDNITVIIGRCVRFGRSDDVFGKPWVEPEGATDLPDTAVPAPTRLPTPKPAATPTPAANARPTQPPPRPEPARPEAMPPGPSSTLVGALVAIIVVAFGATGVALAKIMGVW